MSQRKEPAIKNERLDQLLAGGQSDLLDSFKKALTERALNAYAALKLNKLSDWTPNQFGQLIPTGQLPLIWPGLMNDSSLGIDYQKVVPSEI